MTIDFDADTQLISTATDPPQQRAISVIALEDLPAACAHLRDKVSEYQRHSQAVKIRIRISPHVEDPPGVLGNESPVPGSNLMKYLEPLRHVRGASSVEIDGPVHHPYLAEFKATMLGNHLRAAELMEHADKHFDQGDDAFSKDNLKIAMAEYKAALSVIRCFKLGKYWDAEFHESVVCGRYRGIWAGLARHQASVRLHALIAELYLQSGDLRLARVYVERIYGPRYSLDTRLNHQKFPLELLE